MTEKIVANVARSGHEVILVNGEYIPNYELPVGGVSADEVRKIGDTRYYKIGEVVNGATYSDAVNYNQHQQLQGWLETKVAMLEGRIKALEDKVKP